MSLNHSGNRGAIHFSTPSGRPLIELYQTADASTFLHESGHLYLEMLRSLAMDERATPEIRALWEQAKTALGVQYNGQGYLWTIQKIGRILRRSECQFLKYYFKNLSRRARVSIRPSA